MFVNGEMMGGIGFRKTRELIKVPIFRTESKLETFELKLDLLSKHLSTEIKVPVNHFSYLVLVNSMRSEAPGPIRVARWFQGKLGGVEAGQLQ